MRREITESRFTLTLTERVEHRMASPSETKLEILSYDDAEKDFTVKSPAGNILKVQDTFAEMFPLWAGRILITAENEKWARIAANVTTGFATSVIMAPAEAAVERYLPADQTPDKRPGALVQIYNRDRFTLKHQLMERIGQCIMTCPTTTAFNGLLGKRVLRVGNSLRYFGDGFQKKTSTNHPYCPTLRTLVPDSVVPENVNCVYEIVMNGLTLDAVKNATKQGVTAAASVHGVVKISSGNYGGKLGA